MTRLSGAYDHLAPLALLAATAAMISAGGGAVLDLLFAPMSLLTAIVLYLRSPGRGYISLCLWLWFLTPLVRRLVDLQAGYSPISLVMLAPLLATSVAMLGLWRRRFWASGEINLIVCIVAYGTVLGLAQGEVFPASYAALGYLAPLAFACHVLSREDLHQEMATTFLRTLAAACLVAGLYGIDQYFNLRPWDAHWMIAADMASIGLPLPQLVRVFGPLNSPFPFALVIGAGLLAVFDPRSGWVRWAAAPVGLVAFGLSMVRISWLGTAAGMLALLLLGRGGQRLRQLSVAAVILLAAGPILLSGGISERVLARLSTFGSLGSDESFMDRLGFVEQMFGDVWRLIIGNGIGTTGLPTKLSSGDGDFGSLRVFDNGVLEVFFSFGILGLGVLLAVASLVLKALAAARRDAGARVPTAIALALLVQMLGANTLNGLGGKLMFPMLLLAIAQPGPAARNHAVAIP